MGGDERTGAVDGIGRRPFLAAVGTTTACGLAGCTGGGDPTPTDGSGDETPTATRPARDRVPGLRVALQAGAGVTTDAAGRVEAWADQSGNGYEFTPGGQASRPTVAEDAVAGQPALVFDGEDDHLGRADTLGVPNDSPRTFVVVSRLAEPTVRSPVLMQGELGSENQFYGLEANTFETAGERFGVYFIGSAHDSTRETDTMFHVHTLRTEAFADQGAVQNTTTYYIDGAAVALEQLSSGRGPDTSFTGEATAIGAFPVEGTPTVTHAGEIAAVLVYDRALTDAERSTVEGAMAGRYGIELD